MSNTTNEPMEAGLWGTALTQLQMWDPTWTEKCLKMSTDP